MCVCAGGMWYTWKKTQAYNTFKAEGIQIKQTLGETR